MAPVTYTVDMVLQAHVKGVLDAVVNVLVVEITDIFRTCLALEQRDVYHAGSYVGFTDPAELQHRLRKSLRHIRQFGPSPGSDEEFSTAMSSPTPPSVSKQASSQVLPEFRSAHSVDATGSKVTPDLPVVIEMFAGDANVLLSELTSRQDGQEVERGSLGQPSQGPPSVHSQTGAKKKRGKAPTAQIEQAAEEQVSLSGSEEDLKLADCTTPPADGSVSSLSVFSLKMEAEATPGIPLLCESQGTDEAEVVDHTPPQSPTLQSPLTSPTESRTSPGPACGAVDEENEEVKEGQQETKRWSYEEQKEEEEELMEKEDGSSDRQSVMSPCSTQTFSAPVAKEEEAEVEEEAEMGAAAEQAGERTVEDGANASLLLDCPSLQHISQTLDCPSVQHVSLALDCPSVQHVSLALDCSSLQHVSLAHDCPTPQHVSLAHDCPSPQHVSLAHDCPTPQHVSLALPSCSVLLKRLPSRLTRKQRTLLVCLDCARVFRSFKSLSKHRRFHSGETPFHCPQCPRRFILRKNMRRHLRRHTGEKPYRCPQCGKAFRLHKGLDKHMHSRHRAS